MENGSRRTAFVTGGTGFLGLNLCEQLLENGWRVLALYRKNADLTYLGKLDVELVPGDILDIQSLFGIFPRDVDAVFHLAGDLNTWSKRNAVQTAVNVDGTRNMVEASLRAGAKRFIFTSAIASYGIQDICIDEATTSTASASPINYIRDKWLAEEIVRDATKERGLSSSIMVPCGILGPKDRHSWATVIYQIRDGKLPGIPPGHLPFSHVSEVVKAHIAAVDKGKPGESYILAGINASYEDLFHQIADTIGANITMKVAPAWMLKFAARIQVMLASITHREPDITPEMAIILSSNVLANDDKARQELGFKHVPLKEAVVDCVEWLKREKLF